MGYAGGGGGGVRPPFFGVGTHNVFNRDSNILQSYEITFELNLFHLAQI